MVSKYFIKIFSKKKRKWKGVTVFKTMNRNTPLEVQIYKISAFAYIAILNYFIERRVIYTRYTLKYSTTKEITTNYNTVYILRQFLCLVANLLWNN